MAQRALNCCVCVCVLLACECRRWWRVSVALPALSPDTDACRRNLNRRQCAIGLNSAAGRAERAGVTYVAGVAKRGGVARYENNDQGRSYDQGLPSPAEDDYLCSSTVRVHEISQISTSVSE